MSTYKSVRIRVSDLDLLERIHRHTGKSRAGLLGQMVRFEAEYLGLVQAAPQDIPAPHPSLFDDPPTVLEKPR